MVKIVIGTRLKSLFEAMSGPQECCINCGWKRWPHQNKDLTVGCRKTEPQSIHRFSLMDCPGYAPMAPSSETRN